MVSAAARHGGDRSGNNLHLKKEVTQIRKAARVLRDPGTSSSSWWSPPPPPLGSARSPTVKNGGNASDHFLQLGNRNNSSSNIPKSEEKEKRRVYLCNWKSQKSDSLISREIGDDEADFENGKDEVSSSIETDSLSNLRSGGGRNDSKSDGYFSDRFTAAMFKCMDSSITPSIRLTRKKRLKRSNYSSPSSFHRKEKRRIKMLLSRLGRDGDFLNSIDRSDDNSNSCSYEDLGSGSAVSHLLGRIKSKAMPCPPMKMMMSHSKEEDSISYKYNNRYATRNPHSVESWVATTVSFNNFDDQLDSPGRQGCGIPCYWSRGSTPKSRYGTSCSPSLDTLRRKGSTLFRGNTISQRRHSLVSLGSNKRRLNSNTAEKSLVPLLYKGADGLAESSMRDEFLTNLLELDLEALSHFDGRRRFSSCRSREGLELVPLNREVDREDSLEHIKSLSHKYRPMCFDELIEQNIVVQSLKSAIARRRIASIYLFHGPRGVGKTSMARIFAAALNCLATEESKPCGVCRECADFVYGKSRFLEEVDSSNKKGVDQLRNLVNVSEVHPLTQPHYKVIVIDHCQLLPSKTWLEFLRLLDKPLPFIVFVLITTDIDHVPQTILTRCQKHVFNKISNGDIVTRLRKISIEENLDVESKALELIALNADGSLRDAETMLDQLSLFDKRITKSLVNELMGVVVVSEDKLLKLLELAMSSNASETVRKSREVMDSGVDPLVLISQLVGLIVDIIAGTYPSVDTEHNDSFFGGRSLTGSELNRLKHALTLLSEAEKHIRVSSEQSTWFTATLLQLGSMPSSSRSQSTSSRRQTSKATQEDLASIRREAYSDEQFTPEKSDSPASFMVSEHRNSTSKDKQVGLTPKTNQGRFIDGKSLSLPYDDCISRRSTMSCVDSEMLTNIWLLCIDECRSKTLRLLLQSCARLVSISETESGFIAQIAFEDSNTKSRAEGFLSSITNSLEVVLQSNVEVRITLLRDSLDHKLIDRIPINLEDESTRSSASRQDPSKISRKSSDMSRGHQKKCLAGMGDGKSGIPLRPSEPIHEQGLGSVRLEALDKGTPAKNGMNHLNEEELIHGMQTLEMNEATTFQEKDRIVRKMDRPISPSALHDGMRYESGSGGRNACCCFRFNFCWKEKQDIKANKKTSSSSSS